MSEKKKVLFATRALESPPAEGGFLLLLDIAKSFVGDESIEPTVFSALQNSNEGLNTKKVFTKTGWSAKAKYQFLVSLLLESRHYDVVHTAHVPTKKNVLWLKYISKRARHISSVKFVQTITALPQEVDSNDINAFLWGDYIVCQSQSAYNKVKSVRENVSLIIPWPSPSRIALNEQRYHNTRDKLLTQHKKLVVFPGEFKRLGIGSDFMACIQKFISEQPNVLLVLACRFDHDNIGRTLADQFPENVLSLGETDTIISLLEAADLVIFPARNMDGKFQPPLVIMESLQLGTPVLASNIVDVEGSLPKYIDFCSANNWESFAQKMSEMLESTPSMNRSFQKNSYYKNMITNYKHIYANLKGNT